MMCVGSDGWGGIPIVGIQCITSPNLSLYNIVVLPAASKPTWIRIFFFCLCMMGRWRVMTTGVCREYH